MVKLEPLNALHRPPHQCDRIGQVTITENCDLSIASVALRAGASIPGLPRPGHYEQGAFWIAPGQWFITGPYSLDFAKQVKKRYGESVSVTDQTDAWSVFEVEGPLALFERLCNINLRDTEDDPATRTVIEHMTCFVLRHPTTFQVFAERSSANSMHHALLTAAKAIA